MLSCPFSNFLLALVLASVAEFSGILHWFEGDDDSYVDNFSAAFLLPSCVHAIYQVGLTRVQDHCK